MKLKKVTKNDPKERLAVTVFRSTMQKLERYQQHYAETYGDEIELSQLVEEILRDFMETDKDFQKALLTKPVRPSTDPRPNQVTSLDDEILASQRQ